MARELLKFVPSNHPLISTTGKLPHDLADDAGIVDMLLHPQDRAYSVPEIMEFVEAAGLIFFGWNDNALYCADRFLSGEMLERVLALPAAEQWAIIDNLAMLNDRHDFFVRKPQSTRFLTRFDTDDFLSYVPLVRAGTKLAGEVNSLKVTRASPHGEVMIPISRSEALLLEQADGNKSISEILSHPMFMRSEPEQRTKFARVVFERMWRSGHLLFGRSNV
jgi:hypothetical protein